MTRQTRRRISAELTAVALGLVGAFIVVVSVFADGPWAERRFVILAILMGYGCAGFLIGWGGRSWRTVLWLSSPALPVLLVFGEDTRFALVYIGLILGCATLGGGIGAHVRGPTHSTVRDVGDSRQRFP